MKNPRITSRDRNAIKGALRRAFARSELHKDVIEQSRVVHHDPKRPRVTKWSRCRSCDALTPTYLIEVDHISPLIETHRTLEDMTWDEVVDRLWCDRHNLWGICSTCHSDKSRREQEERKAAKKARQVKAAVKEVLTSIEKNSKV